MSVEKRPDTSQGPNLEGQAYAWGKTARKITQTHFFKVLKDASNFTAVDLCSAYPLYAHIMSGQYKAKLLEQAQGKGGKLFHNHFDKRSKMTAHFPSTQHLSEDEFSWLRSELEQREAIPRQLLHSVLFDLFLSPPPNLTGLKTKEKKKKTYKYLKEGFSNRTNISYSTNEVPAEEKNEAWPIITGQDLRTTFERQMAYILGPAQAEAFIDEVAVQLAESLTGSLRTFSIFSLDHKTFPELIREARYSFPKRLRNTHFYRSAIDPGTHIEADLVQLPFMTNSVSFFACIEGWPFYLSGLQPEEQFQIADQIVNMLQPGGRAVFFPWRFQEQTMAHRETLKKIEEFWKSKGMNIFYERYRIEKLQEDMSDREYVLANRSPVFKERIKTLTALVIEKPKVD